MGIHCALLSAVTQYEIMNEYNLHRLGAFNNVILPDQRHLTSERVGAFINFVAAGGNLIATFHPSVLGGDGKPLPNFALADRLNVDLVDQSHLNIHFFGRWSCCGRASEPCFAHQTRGYESRTSHWCLDTRLVAQPRF